VAARDEVAPHRLTCTNCTYCNLRASCSGWEDARKMWGHHEEAAGTTRRRTKNRRSSAWAVDLRHRLVRAGRRVTTDPEELRPWLSERGARRPLQGTQTKVTRGLCRDGVHPPRVRGRALPLRTHYMWLEDDPEFAKAFDRAKEVAPTSWKKKRAVAPSSAPVNRSTTRAAWSATSRIIPTCC
jgi:hypothetical protein